MSNPELVHEISAEKDSSILNFKAKLNNLSLHNASPVRHDTQELATQLASNLDSDHEPSASVVNDEVLVRSNTVPYIFANAEKINHFGDAFHTTNMPSVEKVYQASLLATPQHHRTYVGEALNNNSEIITMMMMILLIVVIAIVLQLVVQQVERNSIVDDRNTYILMAQRNNNDPVLREMRYMPISENRDTCNIM